MKTQIASSIKSSLWRLAANEILEEVRSLRREEINDIFKGSSSINIFSFQTCTEGLTASTCGPNPKWSPLASLLGSSPLTLGWD